MTVPDNPGYQERTTERELIARWLADRWGYKTIPEACWNDADELLWRLGLAK